MSIRYHFGKHYTPTDIVLMAKTNQRAAVSIGERRKPKSYGEPGYLRMDTVHQGDYSGLMKVDS